MKFYNTLSRKIEEFKPVGHEVTLYTCGPTVYDYLHIGNWRTYVFEDLLRRTLEYDGYKVKHVMNVTDVGHLTGDNVGNADIGEDRMEKAAKREGKSAWDIAKFYTQDFIESEKKLKIEPPDFLEAATSHINEQIQLIAALLDKGFAYKTDRAIYFNVEKFPNYGTLGGQKLIDKRNLSREELVEDNDKKNPADFALWKFSTTGVKRQMEWKSPWGVGFPGWHIECSAISLEFLAGAFPKGKFTPENTQTINIHTGGVDHIAIHHTNEIAQSEAATGKKFVNYWIHGEFLTVDGGRMGKSLGNAYTLHDVVNKGIDPLSLRYFYLGAHYRTVLNFTWGALAGAQKALSKLRWVVSDLKAVVEKEKGKTRIGCAEYETRFLEAVSNDLKVPEALAVFWKLINDESLPSSAKLKSMVLFDKVLGLGLSEIPASTEVEIPEEVKELLDKRNSLREEKKFAESDAVREEIEKMGYTIEDTPEGSRVRKLG